MICAHCGGMMNTVALAIPPGTATLVISFMAPFDITCPGCKRITKMVMQPRLLTDDEWALVCQVELTTDKG